MEDRFARWSRDLRASNRSAFTELFEALHEALLRYAWRLTHDEQAAQDVVQEAFLKLWRVRATLDPNRSLKALLYTMVRNLAFNHNRSQKQGLSVVPLDEAPEATTEAEAEAAADAQMLALQLKRWVAAMPDRRREAFMLSRYAGLSHDEIATVMNLTPRTVNTHIVLALQYLRTCLRTVEPDRTAT